MLIAVLIRESHDRFPRSLRALEAAAGAPLLGIASPSGPRIRRGARNAGVPTSITGIRGRLGREPHTVVALVDLGTADGQSAEGTLRLDALTASTGHARPELWRVPLTDEISTLPEDAVAVLLVAEDASRGAVARAAQFCAGHGIEVVGCIVDGAMGAKPEEDQQDDPSGADGALPDAGRSTSTAAKWPVSAKGES
jgi:hypothetical protein